MGKKEFNARNYSRIMFLLCSTGGVLAVVANFFRFMIVEKYQNLGYMVFYGAYIIVSAAVYCVRNQYDDRFCKSHRNYAVFAGIAGITMLGLRIFMPEILNGELSSLFGNSIDIDVLATFILIALIGKPMLDIVDTMRYVQPAPTHMLKKDEEEN